jgi:hypothetical protein
MGCGASTGSSAIPSAERAVTSGTTPPVADDDRNPHWDYFVSHVQAETEAYAVDLWSSLRAAGDEVWLDVKMDERDEEAMERGLQASKAVVCILSKSYFQRPFCVKELSWACKYDKPVIICVPSELKGFIGEFGGQPPKGAGTAMVVAAPGFLRGLMKIDIMTLDRSDNKYWQVGVDKVRGAARKTIQPILKPGATINSATEEALIALSAHPAAGDDDTDDGLANGQRPDAVYATSARKYLTFATERGFYSRLFKYDMDKVTADRAFEVRLSDLGLLGILVLMSDVASPESLRASPVVLEQLCCTGLSKAPHLLLSLHASPRSAGLGYVFDHPGGQGGGA